MQLPLHTPTQILREATKCTGLGAVHTVDADEPLGHYPWYSQDERYVPQVQADGGRLSGELRGVLETGTQCQQQQRRRQGCSKHCMDRRAATTPGAARTGDTGRPRAARAADGAQTPGLLCLKK